MVLWVSYVVDICGSVRALLITVGCQLSVLAAELVSAEHLHAYSLPPVGVSALVPGTNPCLSVSSHL